MIRNAIPDFLGKQRHLIQNFRQLISNAIPDFLEKKKHIFSVLWDIPDYLEKNTHLTDSPSDDP
jgi:hypothetical protein